MFPRRTKPESEPPATPMTPSPIAGSGWMKNENNIVAFAVTSGTVEDCAVNIGRSVPFGNGKKLKKSKGPAVAAAAANEMEGVEDAELGGSGGSDGDDDGGDSEGTGGNEYKDNVGGRSNPNAQVDKINMELPPFPPPPPIAGDKVEKVAIARRLFTVNNDVNSHWKGLRVVFFYLALAFIAIAVVPCLGAEDPWQEFIRRMKETHAAGMRNHL